jgi:leader peptidase (prepilin peptidase)/N-methyltransferase
MIVSQVVDAGLAGVVGLLVGSFLNVVIYRLPRMLEQQWAAECAELAGKAAEPAPAEFNLMRPASRCRQCGHAIRWFENVPVLSYLVLRGKCSACATPIGLRYPAVELATAALFFFAVWRWGATPAGAAWCGFSAAIVALALIDWDTTLLPDALWGAVAGYVSLWLIYKAFKLLTGKEGMGYGDFKLFAALGAWFGWQALVPIILMASVIGAVVGIAMKFSSGLREGGYVPFGPFLAGAGLTAMIFGPSSILAVIGL